jgi:hypothetical protein
MELVSWAAASLRMNEKLGGRLVGC